MYDSGPFWQQNSAPDWSRAYIGNKFLGFWLLKRVRGVLLVKKDLILLIKMRNESDRSRAWEKGVCCLLRVRSCLTHVCGRFQPLQPFSVFKGHLEPRFHVNGQLRVLVPRFHGNAGNGLWASFPSIRNRNRQWQLTWRCLPEVLRPSWTKRVRWGESVLLMPLPDHVTRTQTRSNIDRWRFGHSSRVIFSITQFLFKKSRVP